MTMTMTDVTRARILAHNIARYRRILAPGLTELERSFVVKRLTEEKLSLRTLVSCPPEEAPIKPSDALERAA